MTAILLTHHDRHNSEQPTTSSKGTKEIFQNGVNNDNTSSPNRRQTKKPRIPQWRDALAGACAGAFSKTALAPIERIKLLLQLQGSFSSISDNKPSEIIQKGVSATPPKTANTNPTAWHVAQNVYQREGIAAFWRGNMANVMRTAGQSALNFAMMDYYKELALSPVFASAAPIQRRGTTIRQQQHRRKMWISFISGGLAGGTATTVLYPIEFVRTRLAMDQGRSSRQYKGMADVVTQIWNKDGIRGFYQGYGIALTGGVLYRLLYLGGYDAVKSEWLEWKLLCSILDAKNAPSSSNSTMSSEPDPALTWGERFLAAQTISLSAGTICYPIDSVRRRLMMQAGKPVSERLYRGSVQCIRTIFAMEGIKGFYLGIGPNLLRSVGGALMLVGYDGFKTMM